MTLENTILTSLSEWRTPDPGERTVAEGGWAVQLSVDKCEDLGCRLREVAVRRTSPETTGTLRRWADNLCEQTRSLADMLKVVEVDEQRQEAVLRSETPTPRQDKVLYFEVLLKGTREAVLRRYRGTPNGGAKREQVAFVLTHEAVAAAAQALASSL
jgi:hypothetical protein